ncbi:MAG TPA: CCA tRNA nucleotidyltransferase [Firmicutes bacterium]|jgi:tRNA nucleotidyltransferase (CCA-adding enzyme)|nr:CCA tRNA nucleotidyltransferase [Bacillota bacterium]
MTNLAHHINSSLSKELHAMIYLLGFFAQKKSFKVYAVGGFVRDLLLGKENRDLDLVVEGSAVDFAKYVAKNLPGQLQCFERFGTAKLSLSKGIVFDMVTARQEFYAGPGALPDVERSSLKNDLYRRDFTINTMACALNPENFGRLYDFFGGRKDLEKGIIRVLYKLSFVDDPLRIIRAIRFEQRFNFIIEEETLTMLRKAIGNRVLEKVSKERLYNEIRLIFTEPSPLKVLIRLNEMQLLKVIFPRLEFNERLKERLRRLEKGITELVESDPEGKWNYFILYLSALFYDLSEHDTAYLCHLMRLRRKERLRLFAVLKKTPKAIPELKKEFIRPARLYFLLNEIPLEGLLLMTVLEKNDPYLREHISYYRRELVHRRLLTNGDDLLEKGLTQGPVFNRVLKSLHEAVLNGKVSGKEEELEYLSYLIKKNNMYQETGEGEK